MRGRVKKIRPSCVLERFSVGPGDTGTDRPENLLGLTFSRGGTFGASWRMSRRLMEGVQEHVFDEDGNFVLLSPLPS